MASRAFVIGLSGPVISPEERAFVSDAHPWGLIIFKRNVEKPEQLKRLVSDFRDAVGRDAPVLVDQEGGRVQRLGPPHWPSYPPGAAYGRLYDRDPHTALGAAWLGGRLIATDLQPLGIDVDCLPVVDIPVADADAVIGDRAYGESPGKVAALANAIAHGLLAGGVLPVVKHLPGHGRAKADSHKALPIVDADRASLEASDFAAFQPLSGLPLGMTAHVVFSAIDAVAPATTSAIMINQVIRGTIGFQGLLMSDDISMGALSGALSARTRAALAAGCDIVLHCNGEISEMHKVATAAPVLAGDASRRAEAALALRSPTEGFDITAARVRFENLMRDAHAGSLAS